MRDRAVRRHHLRRAKKRVTVTHAAWFEKFDRTRRRIVEVPPTERARLLGILARTRTPCSCIYCRNPRRVTNEKTLQERRHEMPEDR